MDMSMDSGGHELFLIDLVDKESVKLNIEVKDWQDAVRKSGELLVRKGAAGEGYINAMIRMVKEFGSYIVITKGVALPHAKPEEGGKGTAIALVKLSTPVEFGNPDNDPVDIVIPFVAADDTSYVQALAQLTGLVQEPYISQIRSASSPDEIYDIIVNIVKEAEIKKYKESLQKMAETIMEAIKKAPLANEAFLKVVLTAIIREISNKYTLETDEPDFDSIMKEVVKKAEPRDALLALGLGFVEADATILGFVSVMTRSIIKNITKIVVFELLPFVKKESRCV